jgi:hypothetical protein
MDEAALRKLAYFASFFSLVLASPYLFGYWGSFRFNVLEFIGLSDVLAYALFTRSWHQLFSS